jgi:hypothetical protein
LLLVVVGGVRRRGARCPCATGSGCTPAAAQQHTARIHTHTHTYTYTYTYTRTRAASARAHLDDEVDDGHVGRGHAQRDAVELALELGQHERDGLGGASGRGHNVERGGARAAQVTVAGVQQALVTCPGWVCVCVGGCGRVGAGVCGGARGCVAGRVAGEVCLQRAVPVCGARTEQTRAQAGAARPGAVRATPHTHVHKPAPAHTRAHARARARQRPHLCTSAWWSSCP